MSTWLVLYDEAGREIEALPFDTVLTSPTWADFERWVKEAQAQLDYEPRYGTIVCDPQTYQRYIELWWASQR